MTCNSQYKTLEYAVTNFTLVFDNAENEIMSQSQIYLDAQTLARLAYKAFQVQKEKKEQMGTEEWKVQGQLMILIRHQEDSFYKYHLTSIL